MNRFMLVRATMLVLLVISGISRPFNVLSLESPLTISSYGSIINADPTVELGVFFVPEWAGGPDYPLPEEAGWAVTSHPYQEGYAQIPEDTLVILDWYWLHIPFDDWGNVVNTFKTEFELEEVEEQLKSIPVENFWGVLFIAEEIVRIHIDFDDDLNTTWFGETLLGYPLFLEESPSSTRDHWLDVMYFRMVQGFYNYFHGQTKIGITVDRSTIMSDWHMNYYFGELAMNFIRQYYDFVVVYAYTQNLEDFLYGVNARNQWAVNEYLSKIEELFEQQKKFWILTRIWNGLNDEYWEREAIALEMKNCLDRNWVITYQYLSDPPFEEVWALILKAIELYNNESPYYEARINGRNLLTDYVGNTYGWVEV